MKEKLCCSFLLLLSTSVGCSANSRNFRDHCCSESPEASSAYNQAIEKKKSGDSAEAIRLYEQALRISPNYTCAQVNLGLLYWKQKRLSEALDLLSRASAMEPRDVLLHGNLGDLQREMGNLSAAEAEFQKAIALDPKRGKAFYRLAGVQKLQKHYAEAAANYEKFLAATDAESKDAKYVAYAHSYLAWYATFSKNGGNQTPAGSPSTKTQQSPNSAGGATASKSTAGKESLSVTTHGKPAGEQRDCKPESQAFVLLLDKSGSVKDDNLVKSETAAAAKLIPQLKNNILFSIVAFDSAPFILVKEEKLGKQQKEIAIRRLEMLFPTGVTRLLPALNFARLSLEKSSAQCKSIILMSDGKIPIEPDTLIPELDTLRADGIHLSVIQLGSDGDSALMKVLARAGNGVHYQANGASSIEKALIEGARTFKLLQGK